MRQKFKYVSVVFALASHAFACICAPENSFADRLVGTSARSRRIQSTQAGRFSQNREKNLLPFGLVLADLRHFETSMERISAADHAAIVAEGVPMRSELSNDEANSLLTALASAHDTSIPATLTLVARAYDYDVERGVDNGYLLRKHHLDPADLPDVTFLEIVGSLRSLLKIVDGDRSSPAIGGVDPASFLLYNSLSETQKSKSHSDAGLILTLADLGPEQQKYALELAQNITVDSKTSAIRRCLQHLTALQDKSAAFRWTAQPAGMALGQLGRVGSNQRLAPDSVPQFFVYGIPWGRQSAIKEFPLNHRFKIGIDSSGRQVRASAATGISPILHETQSGIMPAASVSVTSAEKDLSQAASSDSTNDPSLPTPQDKLLAPGMMSDKLESTVTLEDLAESLSSNTTIRNTASRLNITIDPALDGKPVTVYGRSNIPGDVLIRLAARVYGLQISTADNRSIYITMPRIRPVHSVRDLQSQIRRVIPPSLLRSFESQIDRIAGPASLNARNSETGDIAEETRGAEKVERDQRNAAATAAEGNWYFPADRRVLVLGTAAVPTPTSPPVAVASLGQEPSRLIALMLLTAGPLARMRELLGFEPPLCLTDPSKLQILLTCHEHGNKQGITFRIRSIESTGDPKFEGGGAFSHDTPR